MIKSMLLYRVNHLAHTALLNDYGTFNQVLADQPERKPVGSQWSASGFAPLNADLNEELVWSAPGGVNVAVLMIHERALTAATINEHVAERAKSLAAREDRPLYRKEYAQIKDEVTKELLPKAFIKHKRVPILVLGDLLVIGATTAKVAEHVLDVLRGVMGSLNVEPFATKLPPVELLTYLVREGDTGHLHRGDTLKLANESKDVVTFKGVSLGSDEVKSLLDDLFVPKEMTVWLTDKNDEMVCKVTDTLIFKGMKFAEDLVRVSHADADGDPAALIDADLIMLIDTIKHLVRELIKFGGEDRRDVKRDDSRLKITAINGVSLEDLFDDETRLANLRDQFQSGGQADTVDEDQEFEDF